MEEKKETKAMDKDVKTFLVHLIIFVVVNIVILFAPVFYDRKIVFDFEERGPMLYGSIGWGIGLVIHGLVVYISKVLKK